MGARGFSMVELMVAVSIVGLVLGLGVPSLVQQVRDGRIRTLADEFHDGLQAARQEAIQRNTTIRFDVVAGGFRVVLPGASDTVLASRTALTTESRYAATASAATLAFNGSGRASTSSFRIDFSLSGSECKATGGANRCLRVTVQPGGAIRMCDPAAGTSDPRSCA